MKAIYETENNIVIGTVVEFLLDRKHLILRNDDSCAFLKLRVNEVEFLDAQDKPVLH